MDKQQYIQRLQMVISHMHGCDSAHVETVPVHETFRGETVWDGEVEVFTVEHERAKKAYAWGYTDTDGSQRFAAVLGQRPVNSPLDAVKAFIVSETRRKNP